ncbi:type II secretion system protein, partial [Sulfurihydrogenibium yellowstonense SS-5]
MATFTYEGRDKFGIKKTGTITAESIEEAEDILKNQGFVDVKIKLKSTKEKEKSKGGGT